MKIGILGGIGPESTGEFYLKLIAELQKSGKIKDNSDFPQIVINSIPAPELVGDEITKEMIKPYHEGLAELDKMNVDFIVMVCNTIHLYLDELQKGIETPIINLPEKVVNKLKKEKVKRVLTIATPSTIKKGLYQDDSFKTIAPSKQELSMIGDAIFEFNKGNNKKKQTQKVREIVKTYLEREVDYVILGCTELAVMLGKEDFPALNPMDILVEVVIKFS